MTARHAPGPWATKPQGEANHHAILLENGKWLAALQFNGELTEAQQEASARLIVAAPELLAALKDLLNYENLGAYDRADVRKQARAAIAKAGA